MDKGAWWATVHGVTKSQTQLSNTHTHTHTHTQRWKGNIQMQRLISKVMKRDNFKRLLISLAKE